MADYEVIRAFRQTDSKTGENTAFEAGDDYTGPTNLKYLLDPEGPDGKGPLIAKKASKSGGDNSGKSTSTDSSKDK